jgi:hypothetical protein
MKPFLCDPAITNPVDVARRDHMEFFVEKNLSHRGLPKRSHIKFLGKTTPIQRTHGSCDAGRVGG